MAQCRAALVALAAKWAEQLPSGVGPPVATAALGLLEESPMFYPLEDSPPSALSGNVEQLLAKAQEVGRKRDAPEHSRWVDSSLADRARRLHQAINAPNVAPPPARGPGHALSPLAITDKPSCEWASIWQVRLDNAPHYFDAIRELRFFALGNSRKRSGATGSREGKRDLECTCMPAPAAMRTDTAGGAPRPRALEPREYKPTCLLPAGPYIELGARGRQG